MNTRLYLVGLVAGVALIAAACGPSEPAPDTGAAPQEEPTTTTTTAAPEQEAYEDEDDDAPSGPTLDTYLVAVINTTADWGDCVVKVEQDLNDAQPEEPTEEYMLEYAIAYVGGHIECWQGEHDAIAALEPSAEAAAAHADLVESRAAHLAAFRTAFDNVETADDYFPLLFEPPPDVIAAYIIWVDACLALESVARSNGVDAELSCPIPVGPPAGDPTPVTVLIDASEWLVEPGGVLQDEGSGVEITIVNSDDVAHKPVIIFLISGSSSTLPMIGGLLDLSLSGNSDATDPGATFFGSVYPESLGDNVFVIDELAPGESVTADVNGGGTLVVLDYLPGAYEAGQFVVLEVLPFE